MLGMLGVDIGHLMQTRRYCFWLDRTNPQNVCGETVFPVSVVFEGVHGHFPTGGRGTQPWYWHETACVQANAERGLSEHDVAEIVGSSMAQA